MANRFGNRGEGEKTRIEVPVEFFDNYGPAFFHETAITGTDPDTGHTFEWNRGVAMPGLALILKNPDGNVVGSAYFDETALVRALATTLIRRVTSAPSEHDITETAKEDNGTT